MAAKPLALDYHAHGQGAGWRKGQDLIDALPYIDPLPADVKKQVDGLIEEELKRSPQKPADYLRQLPKFDGPKFDGHPLLAAEYERVKFKQPMPPLDVLRYRLDPPATNKRNDFGAWKQSVDNAYSQLEHQYLRIVNLELLLKHGDKAWRAQTQLDEALVKQLEQELADVRKQIQNLNQERKLQQTTAGSQLYRLGEEYMRALHKNFEIELACNILEDEVYILRTQKEQRIAAKAAAANAAQEGSSNAQPPADVAVSEAADVDMEGPSSTQPSAAQPANGS